MNKLTDIQIVGLGVSAVILLIAIYAIISLAIDYRKETQKAKDMLGGLKTANNAPVPNVKDYKKDVNTSALNNRFTDSGTSINTWRNNAGTYGNFQFVIVKSVIHTETREEIDCII